MRGGVSGDGKLRGNRQMVDRYNEAKGLKGSIAEEPESRSKLGERKQKRPKPGGGESGGAREAAGHDEIKNIVGDHGAAVSHHIYKTHQGYSSTTQHEDGHVHHADHDTLGEAHEHGAHAMGEDTEHLGDMLPEDHEVADEHEAMEAGGAGSSYRGPKTVGYMG